MEFLPVLEARDKPKEGIWYSLLPSGSAPGESVGHTCTFIPSDEGGRGRVLIIGGANPSGTFSHSYVVNLDNDQWECPDWEGLEPRYEHCSFTVDRCAQSVWVFGGAQQTTRSNCIQRISLPDNRAKWKNVPVNGDPPSPRTYHTTSACVQDKLYVFSGGEAGASPVSDQKLHVFDTESSTWFQPQTRGRQPSPRHGHIIAAVCSSIYIHGGMAGDKFHEDMYCLDTQNMTWERVQAKGDVPPGVAAHSAVVLGNNIYIFGGMTANGACNTMYRFNTDKRTWSLMKFEGDVPPNRLDHSMCLLPWKVGGGGSGGEEQASSPAAPDTLNLAFIFGGMDTQGVLYDDCVVTLLT